MNAIRRATIQRRAMAVTGCRRGPKGTGPSRTRTSWCGIRWGFTTCRGRKTGRLCRPRGTSSSCGRLISSPGIRPWICRGSIERGAMTAAKKMTFGLIVGNRGFFPGHLADTGRKEMIAAIEGAGHGVVALDPAEARHGAVESREEARKCAAWFREHREAIDGVVVTLPNFGDERAIADTLRMADLNVPVLVQATPDTPARMTIRDRRDSFCGKMSACNNLTQYGIPYSLTTRHTETTDSEFFRKDLEWFAGVCRVVRGLRRLRIGAIGARPAAFNTVRYSEKILEANGISVETIDLSEILGRIALMIDADAAPKLE